MNSNNTFGDVLSSSPANSGGFVNTLLVKRGDLIRHLHANGCHLQREGSKHAVFINPVLNKRTTVPRHQEIVDFMARKICRDLGIPSPRGRSR